VCLKNCPDCLRARDPDGFAVRVVVVAVLFCGCLLSWFRFVVLGTLSQLSAGCCRLLCGFRYLMARSPVSNTTMAGRDRSHGTMGVLSPQGSP
jgi:hypothetical protein